MLILVNDYLFRWVVLTMKHGSIIVASKPLTGGPECHPVLCRAAEHSEDIYVREICSTALPRS